MHMTTKLSTGFDNVSIEIIKLSIIYIVEPLSHLINNSFMSGLVPDFVKIDRVCPIKKPVYNWLLNYLSQHSILSVNQYCFRNNHDKSMAVLDMIDKITNARDSNAFSIGIFIDLSKAFDTLNHNISIRQARALWYTWCCHTMV